MPDSSQTVIRLNTNDNLVIALADIAAGLCPKGLDTATTQAIPRGHKIASRAIAAGENVIRYGQIIGMALADIPAGAHIHSHNLGMGPHSDDYAIGSECHPLPALPPREFMGYHRPDGTVGTRNYIGILTSQAPSPASLPRPPIKTPNFPPCPISTASCPSFITPAAAWRAITRATIP
jgi:altronate dehydratase